MTEDPRYLQAEFDSVKPGRVSHYTIYSKDTDEPWIINLVCCVCSKKDPPARIATPQWMKEILLKQRSPFKNRLAQCPTCRTILAFHREPPKGVTNYNPFETWKAKLRKRAARKDLERELKRNERRV